LYSLADLNFSDIIIGANSMDGLLPYTPKNIPHSYAGYLTYLNVNYAIFSPIIY